MFMLWSFCWRWLCCCLIVATYAVSSSTSSVSIPVEHSLHQALSHFEVLHKHHLRHKNSIKGSKTIVFSTLGRTFRLNLSSRKGLFAKDLEVKSVGERGETTRHVLDVSHFFTGTLEGEEGSSVTAHLDHAQGVLTASIHTDTEHYYIEPSSRHFSQSHNFHMISYRGSDLTYNITRDSSSSYCGAHSSLISPPPPPPPSFSLPPHAVPAEDPRLLRRQATPLDGDSCPMLLVATSRFHEAYSEGSVDNTILFMVQVIDDIDQNIFRTSLWDEDIQNFGITIKNITVYTSPAEGPPYNSDRTDWDSTVMLRLFSHDDWTEFCLAHLFAYQVFTDGKVGVAYPASAEDVPGGICTEALPNFNGGSIATANVGLSSYQASNGRRLLQAEGRLITAHEIGHNWGSEHDPTSPIGPCNPVLSQEEGKFLMFPSMSDGTQANNDVFSSCSLGLVSQVLRAKSQRCFIGQEKTQCGNYDVEEGEECDAGLPGMLDMDSCCNSNCRLRDNLRCSDVNHVCCQNCAYANTTVVCQTFPPDNSQCYTNVFCTGISETCPDEIPLAEVNSTCRPKGKCLYNGTVCKSADDCTPPPESPFNHVECYDFCRLRNMQQCFCSAEGEDECHFCCQAQRDPSSNNTSCSVVTPVESLPDGTSCVGGLCQGGECTPVTQDLVNRLFSLFTDISINTFLIFMSENIVGSVMFLTAVVWIIVGTLIHCVDQHNFREYRKTITELEEDTAGHLNEDQQDQSILDQMTPLIPDLDSHQRIRRGLSRMGSRTEFPSLDGGHGGPVAPGGHRYSIRGGYRPDRLVHGHTLSSIIERSKSLDPSSAGITQYVSGAGGRKKSLLSEEVGGVAEEGEDEVDGGVAGSPGSSLKVEEKLETLV